MRDLLKLISCGSVDDGKSTLIGRMMYDAGCLKADEKEVLKRESAALYGERLDYSLLLDGLEAEREQRITIDVAYRFLRTGRRSFIIADTPGHTEYTRNMAVGASFASLAVILTDASRGATPQTARHIRICSLMGIRDFVFAVNKMDLVDFREERFRKVKAQITALMAELPCSSRCFIPVSAKEGDNVTTASPRTPWYSGPPLLEYLETVQVEEDAQEGVLLPVQRVGRSPEAGRAYQGCLECGSLSVGDEVTVYPSGERSKVRELLSAGKKTQTASAGEPVSVSLCDELDVSRGCVICRGFFPSVSTRVRAEVLWLDDALPSAGKSYFVKLGTARTPAAIVSVDSVTDVETGFPREGVGSIGRNDLLGITLSFTSPVVTDRFEDHRSLGSFILIDRISRTTAACGIVREPLDNNYIYPVTTSVSPADRARQKGQTPLTLWFTGLPGSGKSTIANEVEKRLFELGRHTMLLDGDSLRSGINAGLGFSAEDRAENIRITAEIAKLMNEAGLTALVSLVSPRTADRANARRIVGERFVEIYVSAGAEVCAKRDTKGYYQRAKEGAIREFTGVSSGYEIPASPELVLDSEHLSAEACAGLVMAHLRELGAL